MNNRTALLFTRYGPGDAPDELKQRLSAIFLGLLNQFMTGFTQTMVKSKL